MRYLQSESNDAAVSASASQVRGPRFLSRWEHSSFSLKSPDLVPVAPRVAFSGMGQARIENNLLFNIYHSISKQHLPTNIIVARKGCQGPVMANCLKCSAKGLCSARVLRTLGALQSNRQG